MSKRERIKERYEKKRKERLKKDRKTEVFPTQKILEELERQLFQRSLAYERFLITQTIKWKKPQERGIPKEDHRKRYYDAIYRILSFKRWEIKIETWEKFPYNCLTIRLEPILESFERERLVSQLLNHCKPLIFEDSIHHADFLNLRISGFLGKSEENLANIYCVSKRYENKPEQFIEKEKYEEAFTLEDLNLLEDYYRIVERFILNEILNRGLTVRYAVRSGEGGVRRKDKYGRRLIVKRKGELPQIVREYKVIELIPDVNLLGSKFVERIVIDFDPGKVTPWYQLTKFVRDVCNLLKNFNFKFSLRFTGGIGFHIVLRGKLDQVPEWYPLADKGLKFETLEERYGEIGIISRALFDFGRLVGLAAAYERKSVARKGHPITLEKEDPAHRYHFIFVDVHSFPNKGVRCLGSLHHKTGKVCIPLLKLPRSDELKSIIRSSYMPEIELPKSFPEEYKNAWIYLICTYPHLLIEPDIYDENIIQKINEFFSTYGFLAESYPVLAERKNSFYREYIW